VLDIVKDFEGRGMVRTQSENWLAESRVPVRAGQQLRVTGRDGLVLEVEPIEETQEENES
jgi:membrane-bound serine protease (ClpP class)